MSDKEYTLEKDAYHNQTEYRENQAGEASERGSSSWKTKSNFKQSRWNRKRVPRSQPTSFLSGTWMGDKKSRVSSCELVSYISIYILYFMSLVTTQSKNCW